ncbi:MAG: DNA topoisomerase (ATP-hydrolyzing) subunit B [Coriobacteriales bacterium]|nr:DNA topoisomerase (ATP-hydrolyzing) subunit B [Coriobacteriales bacterium]
MEESSHYDGRDIKVLKGLEAVRLRPGMYIGSTGPRGLHHLVYEVVDNSVDEALAGFCNTIEVVIHEDNSVTVTDNGRGIPVDKHPTEKKPTVEVVLSQLHAGGKFGEGGYKVSGGLHGVGVSCVNALSRKMIAEVKRDGFLWEMEFAQGKKTVDLHKVKKAAGTGTRITFWVDTTIMESDNYDYDTLLNRMREIAFLTKNIKITMIDERTRDAEGNFRKDVLHYPGGIVEFAKFLNGENEKLPGLSKPIYYEATSDAGEVEFALLWNNGYTSDGVKAFANNIHTTEGGTHLDGFRNALTRTFNEYARSKGLLKDKDGNLSGDDVREGLVGVLSVKLHNPQFEGQTKTKLGNTEMRSVVQAAVTTGISDFLEEHPSAAKAIINKAVQSRKVREAVKKTRDLARRKSLLESSTLPGKLADCSERDPELTEIYIVEGDSAGGSAKMARERSFQAILPLRGKILNIERAGLHRALSSETINSLITAIGTSVGDDFDIEKARYHKVIIMTDADVDGAHIRCLLLTFLYRYMPEMIKRGYVYIAQPPLYRLAVGRKHTYAYSDEQLQLEIGRLAPNTKYTVQRYKGLGEMDPKQLWETTMEPKNRTLLQVTVEDAEKAEEASEAIAKLMGNNVEYRKEFIQKNAKDVRFLDI